MACETSALNPCVSRRAAVAGTLAGCAALALGANVLGAGAPRAAVADEAAGPDVKWPDPQEVLSAETFDASGAVETRQVRMAAKGTNQILPLWLGIADPVCDAPGGMSSDADGLSADVFRTSNLFGTFASPANAEPDPFLSNLFYSYVNPDAGLSAINRDEVALICTGQPSQADTSIAIGGTSNALYFRPDILSGGNSATAYVDLVAAINDGSIGEDNYVEGDESYDPRTIDAMYSYKGNEGFQGTVRGITGMLYNIALMVREIQEEDPTAVTRYGNDAYGIAERFEELFLGVQAAVLEQIESGALPRRTIAAVSSVDRDTQTAQIDYSDPSVQLGHVSMMAAGPQFALQDLTDNLAWVISGGQTPFDTAEGPAVDESASQQGGARGGAGGSGSGSSGGAEGGTGSGSSGTGAGAGAGSGGSGGGSGSGAAESGASSDEPAEGKNNTAPGGTVTISLAELAQADVVIYTGQNQTGVSQAEVEEAFAAAGVADVPLGVYVNPTNTGSGNFDVDKVVFTLDWIGAVYPEVVSSTDLLAYFYSEIDHIADGYLASVMALNCANMTLVGEDTLNHDEAYYRECVEAVRGLVGDGMTYLVSDLERIAAEHPNLEPLRDAEGAYRDRNLAL